MAIGKSATVSVMKVGGRFGILPAASDRRGFQTALERESQPFDQAAYSAVDTLTI
jgi:hypothetical protein